MEDIDAGGDGQPVDKYCNLTVVVLTQLAVMLPPTSGADIAAQKLPHHNKKFFCSADQSQHVDRRSGTGCKGQLCH